MTQGEVEELSFEDQAVGSCEECLELSLFSKTNKQNKVFISFSKFFDTPLGVW